MSFGFHNMLNLRVGALIRLKMDGRLLSYLDELVI